MLGRRCPTLGVLVMIGAGLVVVVVDVVVVGGSSGSTGTSPSPLPSAGSSLSINFVRISSSSEKLKSSRWALGNSRTSRPPKMTIINAALVILESILLDKQERLSVHKCRLGLDIETRPTKDKVELNNIYL